jgi:hypothetical protein
MEIALKMESNVVKRHEGLFACSAHWKAILALGHHLDSAKIRN